MAQTLYHLVHCKGPKNFGPFPSRVLIEKDGHSGAEDAFEERLTEAIVANLADPGLDVEKLARMLYISRPALYRQMKSVYELPPKKLINLIRLRRAAHLLEEGFHNIFEIACMVGYNSQTNFGRCFLKQFGVTPSQYQRLKKNGETVPSI